MTYDEIIFSIVYILYVLITSIISVVFLNRENNINYKLKKKSLKKVNSNFYFRDIPFESIAMAFWVCTHYGIIKNANNLFGAILLKWISENKIDVFEHNGKVVLDMQKLFETEDSFERSVYHLLLGCSNENRLLEEYELIDHFNRNKDNVYKLFLKLKREAEKQLIEKNLIVKKINENGGIKIIVSKELEQKAIELQGLKNFLINFSNIKDRGIIETHLWNEYLIYAELFGIADTVSESFKNVYPGSKNSIGVDLVKFNLINYMVVSLEITSDVLYVFNEGE